MVGAPNEIETRASGFFIKFFNSCTVCSRRFDTHTQTKRDVTTLLLSRHSIRIFDPRALFIPNQQRFDIATRLHS